MTSHGNSSGDGTTSDDYASCYYDEQELGGYDQYRWEHPGWQAHMRMLADRVIALADPTSVLDVGCARGLWVHTLRERGVEAYGVDISEHAIASAQDEVKPFLKVQPATEPFDRRYDLILCSEVLEHMAPADVQLAIDNMCAAADRILFSSSPGDFDEPTHVNTKSTPTWVAWFAERGFYRRTDVDVTFHNPWSVYFEKASLTPHEIVHRYEEQYATLNAELIEKREALLLAHRRISHLHEDRASRGYLDDDALQARHGALIARDHVIGLEAQVSTLRVQLARARVRVRTLRSRLNERNEQIAALRASRTWRVGRAFVAPVSRFKR